MRRGLTILKMRTLEERRLRGDLIETYKILTGKGNAGPQTWFSFGRDTYGNIRTRATTWYLNLVQPPTA